MIKDDEDQDHKLQQFSTTSQNTSIPSTVDIMPKASAKDYTDTDTDIDEDTGASSSAGERITLLELLKSLEQDEVDKEREKQELERARQRQIEQVQRQRVIIWQQSRFLHFEYQRRLAVLDQEEHYRDRVEYSMQIERQELVRELRRKAAKQRQSIDRSRMHPARTAHTTLKRRAETRAGTRYHRDQLAEDSDGFIFLDDSELDSAPVHRRAEPVSDVLSDIKTLVGIGVRLFSGLR